MEGNLNGASPEVVVQRIKKLLREVTELEHRIAILYTRLEKRRKLLEQLQELLESRLVEKEESTY